MNKILIVDDSDADQFLAQTAIEELNLNIEIMQAYDGQEALELLDELEEQPDVIFLDINMPVMSGLEFLEEYSKSDIQSTVVVMLTSSFQQRDKEKSREYKCVKNYFKKPLEVAHIKSILHSPNSTTTPKQSSF